MAAIQREQRILALDDAAQWRARLAGAEDTVAMVGGTFDILQPGNWVALQEARRHAWHVCVVLESDELAAAHAGAGRPQHDVVTRAEFLSHLRGVSAITCLACDQVNAFFRQMRPYLWVSCPARRGTDPLAEPAARYAQQTVDIPQVPACFTEEIHRAIGAGHTPVTVPSGLAVRDGNGAAAAVAVQGGALVTVNGCFDILHIGHLRFLEQARAMGDRLIVLINDDQSVRRYKGPTRPVFPLSFRAAALRGLESVDGVRAFAEDDPLNALRELRPRVQVKGGSYEEARVRQERELVESWGGQLVCTPLVEGFSTSAYICKVLGPYLRRQVPSAP